MSDTDEDIRVVQFGYCYSVRETKARKREIRENVTNDLLERVRVMGLDPLGGDVAFGPEAPMRTVPTVIAGSIEWVKRG